MTPRPARAALLREIRSLRRDNTLLREISLGMPGVKVVRAAMRLHDFKVKHGSDTGSFLVWACALERLDARFVKACARLAKNREKK